MLFNSFEFLIFAPLVLLGHALLGGKPLRVWLVVASYVFYGWANPWYCLLLVASTVLDFNVAQRLHATESPRARRAWLGASLLGNLGLLAGFKYLGFFAQSANELAALAGLSLSFQVPEILLPVGISFYTFQTLSYTIDVYRRNTEPTRDFTTMALYVAFFPQLVAGPIERAGHLLPQLAKKMERTAEDVMVGISRILWGLLKKVVFADTLAMFVRDVYFRPENSPWGDLLLGTYAFAFVIYLDFSAYSDIAIGLARVMGVNIRENFRWPYLARNISEFWRRWHISLSTWLRDYLYIPLGGSRHGHARTVFNVFTVMFLGGLWHGADKKFVCWGLWIGLNLALYHWISNWRGRATDAPKSLRWIDVPGVLLTFHIMLVSWVMFRADSMGDAITIMTRIVSGAGESAFAQPMESVWRTILFVGLAVAAHVVRGLGWTQSVVKVRSPLLMGLFWVVLIAAIALLFPPFRERFVYFQF